MAPDANVPPGNPFARPQPDIAAAMLRAALAYAKGGRAIFPCHWPIPANGAVRCSCGEANCTNIGKHPLGLAVPNGVKDASSDPKAAEWWWKRWPNANIGLAAGIENNLLVLDVDPEHGGDKTLAALETKHGALPATLRAITGSNGRHICFTHVDGLKNSVGKIGGGLDIRTEGGLIIVAPSLHKSGRRYHWGDDNVMGEQATAPQWLIDRIKAAADAPASSSNGTRRPAQTDWQARIANGVAEGGRNDALTRLAGKLLGNRHYEPLLALELLHGFNLRCCHPPLPEDEVDTVFKSIVKRQARKEGFGR